ncbi:MAG: polysaccharide biosynthesis C-terminal domain-containing protein, partial [Oscillospiraceae bacterium]|nr:polysaccharide biosynthesis C-terminal domain-containing protein [Oscillospiraceae bacterium]
CAAVVFGNIAGECFSFLLLLILYIFDAGRYRRSADICAGMTRRILSVALPLAFSSYARTALSTLQNLLVPRGLERSGASSKKALSDYGMIGGMVFPVITFPSAVFYSLAELMVPELTDLQVNGQREKINRAVNTVLKYCLLFAMGVSAALCFFSRELGMSIYSSREVGRFIRILSFLMPVMYLDSITDGLLRGLGQQMYCMYVNIADSVLSVLLVWLTLPRWGIYGYIFMICFTEVFNFSLSMYKLSRITSLQPPAECMAKSLLCAVGSVNIASAALRLLGCSGGAGTLPLSLNIALSFILYALLLRVVGCIHTPRAKASCLTGGIMIKYKKRRYDHGGDDLNGEKRILHSVHRQEKQSALYKMAAGGRTCRRAADSTRHGGAYRPL